jgi:hypothetical protein
MISASLRVFAISLLQFGVLWSLPRRKIQLRFLVDGVKPRHQLFIAVLTGAHRAPIIDAQSKTWRFLIDHPAVCDVRFFGRNPVVTTTGYIRERYIDTRVHPKDTSWHSLCCKVCHASELFARSKAAWLLRICDDCVINPASFPLFLRELDDFANPLLVRVIQGHCIGKEIHRYVYPQGGSGIVFSRFAVLEITSNLTAFLQVCVRIHNDDRGIGVWMLGHGVSAWNATNRWFVGHAFLGTQQRAADIPSLIPKLKPCPERPITGRGIRPYYNRVRDIAFWHDRVPFLTSPVSKMRAQLPDNLWYYPGTGNPGLCLGNDSRRLGYYDT